MRKGKLLLTLLLITIMILASIQTTLAFDKSKIPIHIEVGLFFNSTAKSTLLLKSVHGFEVGRFPENQFITLLNLADHNEIILRKDTYYRGSGRTFVEYTGAIDNITNLQGPFHVQIGEVFNSQNDASIFIKSLNGLKDKPYLVYEGGWKVFIGLYIDQQQAQTNASEIQNITNQTTKVISPSLTRVQVMDTTGQPLLMFDSQENIYFREAHVKQDVPLINVEGRYYRGAITAKRLTNTQLNNGNMSIVNKLPLQEYLYGVVPREMPALWSLEALKAQAVVARSYAVSNINRFRNLGFDLCNTTTSQVYGGHSNGQGALEHINSNRAVDETHSRILTYNGQIANAYYHSNSGGHTENSENVWSAVTPYIRGVKDDFSLGAPNSQWTVVFTKDQIRNFLSNENVHIGEIIDIKVTNVSQYGRVQELIIYGTQGNYVLIKEHTRRVLGGYTQLKSTWFTVNGGGKSENTSGDLAVISSNGVINSIDLSNKSIVSSTGITQIVNTSNIKIYNGKNYRSTEQNSQVSSVTSSDVFEFVGKGFGHGLGMSQWGAKKMAEEGYSYLDILTHYYKGTKVE
ncbi:SpoIID/LytB domain-containing protein [Natronincola ferrireducens]|uniref:Stage II sporulation protein D n=1 Tax=Natronincola ferrireducens TaxID=393762 RepID=A0A1G9CY75_9FIRM|nr:SpoIID/LytB domain-containing protein [Natronincola ferrireducens]SDK56563.1 stage II sporulation protein D [Natronincola ferrireducens]